MLDKFDAAFAFNRQALALRAERQKVLANNISNADTPGFKARDFDFSTAMKKAMAGQKPTNLKLTTTSPRHIDGQASGYTGTKLLYRVPDQPSLDGNTVDMDVERVKFADNTLHYQSDLSVLNMKMRQLRMAMQPAS